MQPWAYCNLTQLDLDVPPSFCLPPFFPPSPLLQLAARNNHSESIRRLVEKGGADVQERNASTGWVALHEAAFRGHTDCVRMLLLLNAPLRPRTPEEDTPRELAVRYKQKEVVDLLGECSCVLMPPFCPSPSLSLSLIKILLYTLSLLTPSLLDSLTLPSHMLCMHLNLQSGLPRTTLNQGLSPQSSFTKPLTEM